jgi:hypothetical protein
MTKDGNTEEKVRPSKFSLSSVAGTAKNYLKTKKTSTVGDAEASNNHLNLNQKALQPGKRPGLNIFVKFAYYLVRGQTCFTFLKKSLER